MKVRWISAGKVGAYRSQSLYHGLAYAFAADSPLTVVVSVPAEPYLCVGFFQDAARELDQDYCRAENLPVIRRETGGGTVYIDSGQVFVQWVCPPGLLPRSVEQRFRLFNRPLIDSLRAFGIPAYHYPVNDVHVQGRKIVGTGAATVGEAEAITGNFLFDFPVTRMSRALNAPGQKFRESVGRSMDRYLTWIRRELKNPPTIEEVVNEYRNQLRFLLGAEIVEGSLSADEEAAISRVEEKFRSESWTYASRSQATASRLVKIHAGVWAGWRSHQKGDTGITICPRMRNGTLDALTVETTRNLGWSSAALEKALLGVPLTPGSVEQCLEKFFRDVPAGERGLTLKEWSEAFLWIRREAEKVSGVQEPGGRKVTAAEVAQFYRHYPGFWFLLEVLTTDASGKAEEMRVLQYDPDKEALREHLMELHDDQMGPCIFVYADPEGRCEINDVPIPQPVN
jgi:lipoate-protein ligase A